MTAWIGRRGLILVLVILLVGGCASQRDPSVVIGQANVVDSTAEGVALQFAVDLQNPNDEPLNLLEFEYEVKVDGVKAYSGIRSAQATLASKSDRKLSIPAVIRFDEMGWSAGQAPDVVRYSISGSLGFVTPGEISQILMDTGLQRPSASFSGAGEIQLK